MSRLSPAAGIVDHTLLGTWCFCREKYWFARKTAVEDFFVCSQRDTIDERQCCEHAPI